MRLAAQGEALPLCPETLGGLPTPRPPCERLGDRILTRNGEDRTDAYHDGARLATEKALAAGCGAAILKSRSPACGHGRIYDGTFSKTLTDGDGVWAEMLAAAGLPIFSEESPPDGQNAFDNAIRPN